MIRRSSSSSGFTFLEALLSLVLLGSLFSASGWWIRAAAETGARTAEPARWEMATRSLFEYLHDSILEGASELEIKERIAAEGSTLRWVSRGRPDATEASSRQLSLEPVSGLLWLTVGEERAVALGDVKAFESRWFEEQAVVSVELVSAHGQRFYREVRVR